MERWVWRRNEQVLTNLCSNIQPSSSAGCLFLCLAPPFSQSLCVWTLLPLETFLLSHSWSPNTSFGLALCWVSPTSSLGPSCPSVTTKSRPKKSESQTSSLLYKQALPYPGWFRLLLFIPWLPPFLGQHLLLLFWHLHFNPNFPLQIYVSDLFYVPFQMICPEH